MIKVRGQALGKLEPEEVKQFIEWAQEAQKRTSFDAEIIGHPLCSMLITEKDDEKLAYLPIQTVLMAEVFVPKPDATNTEKAASLGLFDMYLRKLATALEIGDVYCYVPLTEWDYAEKIQRHGWVEIGDVRLFKKPTGVTVNGRS